MSSHSSLNKFDEDHLYNKVINNHYKKFDKFNDDLLNGKNLPDIKFNDIKLYRGNNSPIDDGKLDKYESYKK